MPCSATSSSMRWPMPHSWSIRTIGKGGTWTGAVEQLDKLKFVPVYVRSNGQTGRGLDGLRDKGAIPWPNPGTPESLDQCLNAGSTSRGVCSAEVTPSSPELHESAPVENEPGEQAPAVVQPSIPSDTLADRPPEKLFATVRSLMEDMEETKTEASVAEYLNVSRTQAGAWLKRFIKEQTRDLFKSTDEHRTAAEIAKALRISAPQVQSPLKRLVDEGAIEKLPRSRPARYRLAGSIGPLFDQGA